ncbi:hypothetical protein GGI22_006007, partial [Coemansia erecta]
MTASNDNGEDQAPRRQKKRPAHAVDSVLTPKSKRTTSATSHKRSTTIPAANTSGGFSKQTPQKSSSGHLGSLPNRGQTESEGASLRKDEMIADVRDRLVKNTACVVDQAQPRNVRRLSLAQTLTERISELIEKHIASSDESDDVFGKELPVKELNEHVKTFLPWTRLKRQKVSAADNEKAMYPMILAFVMYVAQEIQKSILADSTATLDGCRLILPFKKTDTRPNNSDSAERVDIGLCCMAIDSSIKLQDEMDYDSLFALIEAKRGRTEADFASAYAQLFTYSEKIYFYQIDRRFMWGIVCCGTIVNACLFSNYNVHASPDMDMFEPAGRKEFVRLLVGWSLCEWNRLGYDQTITFNHELGCYEVMVPQKDNPKKHTTYYCDDSVVAAQREFGRHCRCLLATKEKPAARLPEGETLKHTVVIKDSWTVYSHPRDNDGQQMDDDDNGETAQRDTEFRWPEDGFVPVEDARNEVRLLKKIKAGLSGMEELDKTYPEIEDGGW